jgi:hypothetical protein
MTDGGAGLRVSTSSPALRPTTTSEPSRPREDSTTRDVLRWTTLGVGLVGVGFGVGFLADAESKAGSLQSFKTDHPTACAGQPTSVLCVQAQGIADDGTKSRALGIAGLAVGGASLAISAALWFWPKRERTSSWISPRVGGDGLGVDVVGHF